MKRIPQFAAPPVIALAASLMLGGAVLAQETTPEATTDPAQVTPDAGTTDETGAPADPLIEGQPEATPASPDPATADVPASPEVVEAPASPAATFAVPEGYSQVTDWTAVTADHLIGATLYAADGSNMGAVTDLVLSHEGPVQAVVADVGGFIGIGAHRVSLGHDQVTLYRDEGGTVIATTTLNEEALKALPAWEPAQ